MHNIHFIINEMNILIKTDDGIASKIHVNTLIIINYEIRDIKTSAMDSTEKKSCLLVI